MFYIHIYNLQNPYFTRIYKSLPIKQTFHMGVAFYMDESFYFNFLDAVINNDKLLHL